MIAGCGGGKPKAEDAAEDNRIAPPSAEVITKEVSMKKYDPSGKLIWEVAADRAAGELSPEGDYTEVDGVTAVIHDEGKPAVKIEAKKGHVSKSTGKLDLHGDVSARSTDGRTSLACDRITWNNNDQVLHATGSVTGESNGMQIGPAKTVDATFKNIKKNMNASTATAFVLTSLIAQGPGITYKDNAGNMSISGVDKFTGKPNANGSMYSFNATGSPFVAKWMRQGIEVTARTVEGSFEVVQRGNAKSWELRSGKFTGNITAKMDGERGNMDMRGMNSFQMELTAENRWKFNGSGSPITVDLPDSGATITGNTFEGFASGTTSRPEWESAILTGGVKAVITQRDRDSGEAYTVTATCPRVEINRQGQFVKLSGGARAEGNHPAMGPGGAVITSPVVILRFDAQMKNVVEVELQR